MKRYTIIHPLFMSFFSKSLYRDVARNWNGLCFGYLLSLLALCVIPSVMRVNAYVSSYLDSEAPKIIKQIPEITISKGRVSINRPEPYFIRDEKTGHPIVTIDTSGRISSLKDAGAPVLLTSTKIMIRKDEGEMRTFDLSDVDGLFIDRSRAYSLVETWEDLFVFVFYPLAVALHFLYNIAVVLFYAATGAIIARILNTQLSYKSLIRLSVISMTPALIFDALLTLAGVNVPHWWIISSITSAAYIFFAVRANSELKTSERTAV